MGRLIRSMDWSRTPLGPIEGWAQSLRTTVSTCLNSRFPILIWWGPELVKIYNDAYVPILGAKHPRSMGARGRDVWPEIWHIIGPMLEGVLHEGQATWSENQFLPLHRYGFSEECYFTFSYSPISDESGGVGGVYCAVTETTRQVLGERRLRILRAVLERTATAETLDEACAEALNELASAKSDVPFAALYAREPATERLSLRAQTGLTRACAERFGAPPRFGRSSPIAAAIASGAPVHLRGSELGELRFSDEESAASAALVMPITLPSDTRPSLALCVGLSPRLAFGEEYRGFLDLLAGHVTSAIASAKSRQDARQRAEMLMELNRAKTTFFNNISHEFRTPLTLMLGPLEDALTSPERALRGENLDVTHRNGVRLLRLVNALLDVARLEAGRLRPRWERVAVSTLVRELAELFRPAIERAGLRLRLDCADDAVICADREMLEKIVLNLVSNAFKHTFEGEIGVVLRREGGDGVRLEVRDTGVGIPEAELPKVFDRFHRVYGQKARSQEGSGIGLSLVQELTRLHGGDVRVESQVGRGTRFSLTLGSGSEHEAVLPSSERAGGASASAMAAAFLSDADQWISDHGELGAGAARQERDRSTRILVVEDNGDLRAYLRGVLSQRWQVETVSNGDVALERVRAAAPDLVLTDVMMPGLDGFGLLRALRADPASADVPVVMLSARAGEEARAEGLERGADDYLVKPFSTRELCARISSQLALAHSARERRQLLEREASARREAALQKQHLVSLFIQAPTPIVILRGREHVIDFVNDPTCRLWGRRREQVLDRPLFSALPELDGQVFRDLLDRVLETGERYVGKELPARLARRGGDQLETAYLNFVYSPLRGVDGDIEGILVLAFDVTDEVVARQELEALRGQAEAASRAKDEFLAMLGHELRNPLSPMLTALQLLRLRGAASREQDILERQVSHLTRLVDDLLDISRITGGKVALERQNLELADVITRAIEIASPLLEQRRHVLDLDVPSQGLGVFGDRARMAQVFSNLLTNAAKYSDAGSRIQVRARRDGGELRVHVLDEGIGIAPELRTKVFDLFMQQPQTLDRARGGLGLGLTIVRSLLELHGGAVSVDARQAGPGSDFLVVLPALDPAVALAPGPSARAMTQAARRARRVLIVDDNQDAADTLKDILTSFGHVVRVAHDAPAALGVSQSFEADVALLDIGLPVMDGYELAQHLRAQHGPRCPYLVAVTGYGQPSDRRRSAAAGFDEHLVKPVDLKLLQHVLEASAEASARAAADPAPRASTDAPGRARADAFATAGPSGADAFAPGATK